VLTLRGGRFRAMLTIRCGFTGKPHNRRILLTVDFGFRGAPVSRVCALCIDGGVAEPRKALFGPRGPRCLRLACISASPFYCGRAQRLLPRSAYSCRLGHLGASFWSAFAGRGARFCVGSARVSAVLFHERAGALLCGPICPLLGSPAVNLYAASAARSLPVSLRGAKAVCSRACSSG
jgi:hypothetical protein